MTVDSEAARSLQASLLAADQASWQAAPKAEPFHLRHQPVAANLKLGPHPPDRHLCSTNRALR
jgi:hypothetical protein